jgi:hypothetical protein
MATVFWFKLPNAATGKMEEAPMKATEAAIEASHGEKILGSAEEVPEDALYGIGFYDSPYAIAGDINPAEQPPI